MFRSTSNFVGCFETSNAKFCVSGALTPIFLMRNVDKQRFFSPKLVFHSSANCSAPENDRIMIDTLIDCAESHEENEVSMN